ncbi:hypothetical protein, partial [Streptococcus canis]|uniref:hypothetical protein n=1 Tax=Streptococcus canis TaxID=1329 RepID=UPI0030DABABB
MSKSKFSYTEGLADDSYFQNPFTSSFTLIVTHLFLIDNYHGQKYYDNSHFKYKKTKFFKTWLQTEDKVL